MKWKIAAIVAVAALAYDEIVIVRNNKKNAQKHTRHLEIFSELANTNDYLSSKLDQHNVPMTDYDLIVLKNLV